MSDDGEWDDLEEDPQEDDRVSVSLEITSKRWTAAEITSAVGMEPDRSWSLGDRRKRFEHIEHPIAFYEFNRWSLFSELPRTASDDQHLDALYDRSAQALARVRDLGDEPFVCLDFYRNLDGRAYQGHGFAVDARWIELLGRVGGSLDVDQYVLRDGPDETD